MVFSLTSPIHTVTKPPGDMDEKRLQPKFLRETFFVHISSWSSRLDLPTGENSRGRRWLLESARVAPRSPEFTTHPRRFGGPRPRNFQAQKCFKTRRFFENHVP